MVSSYQAANPLMMILEGTFRARHEASTMRIFFELFDLLSGNVVDDFEIEQAAIAAMQEARSEQGPEGTANLALLRFEDGHPTLVAMEDEFVALVERAQPTPQLARGPTAGRVPS
jgi:hypothetical protein